jgi:hypothetical protein
MFQPPEEMDPRSTPVMNEQQQLREEYYLPQQLQKHDEFLESVSKQTLVLVFGAFFLGLLLGKSLTPIVLRQ